MGASGGISETVCIIEFFQGHFIAYLHACFYSNKGKSELEEKEDSDSLLETQNYFSLPLLSRCLSFFVLPVTEQAAILYKHRSSVS